MKKIILKRKMFWGALGAATIITPLVLISAVACVPKNNQTINKSNIVINTDPINETLFINQNENLPTLSVKAEVDNKDTKLSYQWYENDQPSTASGKIIDGATGPTYTLSEVDTQKAGNKYYYAVVSASNGDVVVSSKISEIYIIKVSDQLPTINVSMQTKSQMVIVNQTGNLPTFSVSATTNNSNQQLNYQWYSNTTNSNKGGTEIPKATNSWYQVTKSDVLTPQSKYYYVKVTGKINGIELDPVVSETVNLTVSVLPRIMIQKQPVNQTITVGETNLPTFSVETNSINNADLKYQWYSTTNTNGSTKDWNLISGATSASYTVPTTDLNRVGSKHYYVEISGTINGIRLQSINSEVATLKINHLPGIDIINQPQSFERFVGKTTDLPTFSVSVKEINNANLKYQWYSTVNINGSNDWQIINGATRSSYTVPATDLNRVGSKHYYVEISGTLNGLNLNTVYSRTGTLKVNALPTISVTNNPQNLNVIVNQTINLPTFSISATTTTEDPNQQLNYQWYYNDQNSNIGGTAIVGANSSSYKIPASVTKQSGHKYYYAKIDGAIDGLSLKSVYSAVNTLNIDSLPKITIFDQPQSAKAYVDQKTNLPTLSVGASSINGVNLTYQWYSTTNKSGSNKDWHLINGATSSSYTVPTTDLKNAGKKYYYVEISGAIDGIALAPIVSDATTLAIDTMPTISVTTQPQSANVYLNQTTGLPTLSVNISNINGANLTYQWYSNKTNSNTNGTLISGATSSSYKIMASDFESSGKKYYYVKIGGTVNSLSLTPVYSAPATLTIDALPRINVIRQPQNAQVYFSQTNGLPTLSVNASSRNGVHLTYQWYSTTNANTPNNNWTKINGANSSSYKITTSDLNKVGPKYYYVEIGGTFNGTALSPVYSTPATLTVRALPKITITKQPTNIKYDVSWQSQYIPAFEIAAVVKNGGHGTKLRCQWYKIANPLEQGSAEIIPGANNPVYVVPAGEFNNIEQTTVKVITYYCEISGVFNGINLQSVRSNYATITITNSS